MVSFVFVFFILGYSFGQADQLDWLKPETASTDYEAGRQSAINELINNNIIEVPAEAYYLKGNIEQKQSDRLVIRQLPDIFTPIISSDKAEITIIIDNQTAIYLRKEKSAEELNAELEKSTSPETPPLPFKEFQISLSDLKLNDLIYIAATENIKDKTEITAKAIYLNEWFMDHGTHITYHN